MVGKTSLINRFLNYEYDYVCDTIEDYLRTNMTINNKEYLIEIIEGNGEEDYQNMIEMWASFGEGFLLVFAINDKESFQCLNKKRERILKVKNGKFVPMILVGNKQDLSDERKVSYEEAKQLANSWGIEYIETSAKTKFNYKEPFEKISIKIVSTKIKPNKSSCFNCLIC